MIYNDMWLVYSGEKIRFYDMVDGSELNTLAFKNSSSVSASISVVSIFLDVWIQIIKIKNYYFMKVLCRLIFQLIFFKSLAMVVLEFHKVTVVAR